MSKKSIISFLNVVLWFSVNTTFSQVSKFELLGHTIALKKGKITISESISDQNIKCKKDTVLILDGKFSFEGNISYAAEVRLVINDSVFTTTFFLEPGKQYTTINIDSLNNPLIVNNSKTNSEYLKIYKPKMAYYEKKKDNWYTDIWALENNFNQNVPGSIKDSMEIVLTHINRQMDSALLVYIKTYPTSQVAVWNLYNKVYEQGYISIYDSAYKLIDKKLKQSKIGITLKQLLDGGRRTATGKVFPIINAIDSLGKLEKIFTKDLKKYTLVDFWFSNCLPCIRQFDELKYIYQLYESKGFAIIGISIDTKQNKIRWQNTVREYELLWPQFWDIDGKEASQLSITTFPTNFLLDKSGKIIAKNLEPHQLEEFLKLNLHLK